MRRLGMGFVPFGQALPRGARTVGSADQLAAAGAIEGSIDPGEWFERPYHRGTLWEEAMLLGGDGTVLTYLTLG